MIDKELIEKIRQFKEKNRYTLHELSKKIDIQISTIERWLKTGHINKVYAKMVREKLGIE
jgi:transcriptional regulator with XRE-family HTH domain